MPLVTLQSVAKHYGAQEVLSGLTLSIHPGSKTGLIGANGAGKTTMLKLIRGEALPSEGTVNRQVGMRIGYIPQYSGFSDTATVFETLMEEVLIARARLREAEEILSATDGRKIEAALKVYQAARDEYDALKGDDAESRAQKILEKFGLHGKVEQPVETLSGGEKNILSLARATLTMPDLLILDEPGNHLDYMGLAWLEKYVANFPGAVLLVSHNRYLLDRTVSAIFELEHGKITAYDGNYSAYRMEKLRKLVATQADYVADQKKLTRLEELVKRFEQITRATSDPKWGKRLRARRTQLAKARDEATEKPELDTKTMKLSLNGKRTKADIALQINGYSKRFGNVELFKNAEMQISCGERVALVGPNGSGKTTLLRDVVQTGGWDDATLRVGPSLTVGYCAQNQEVFNPKQTILAAFAELGVPNRKEAHKLLSRFLFDWNDLDKKVGSLSGGEMNRLQLARLIALEADFLILDEPTNHLDVYAREAIEDGLEGFQGTILAVSHDRYFLDKIADRIVEIQDCALSAFQGNFSEFWISRTRSREYADQTKNLAQQRQRVRSKTLPQPGRSDRIALLEGRIEALEDEKRQLESRITSLFQERKHIEGRAESNKLDKVSRQLEELYREWEEISGA